MANTIGSPAKGFDARSVVFITLLVLGVVGLALLLWQLTEVLILVFAAILVATLLRAIASPIETWISIPTPWSVLIAVLLIAVLLTGFGYLFGAQLYEQVTSLISQLPSLMTSLEDSLGVENLEAMMSERLQALAAQEGAVQTVAGVTFGTFGVVLNLVLVLVAGTYFSLRPGFYRSGLLMLFPGTVRKKVEVATANAGRALRLWLIGQLVAMIAVGLLTTLGLFAIGMPSAVALGFIAGVADFVPIVGPIAAAIPAMLVALSVSPIMVIWVIGLYVLVQQIEANILVPLIQRRAVDLPPALTLFAVLAAGALFGPIGVVLASPLAVVALVAVKQLYIRDSLDESTTVPGDASPDA